MLGILAARHRALIPAEGEAAEPGSLANAHAIPDRPAAVRDDGKLEGQPS
jgi:hypothetical protein